MCILETIMLEERININIYITLYLSIGKQLRVGIIRVYITTKLRNLTDESVQVAKFIYNLVSQTKMNG